LESPTNSPEESNGRKSGETTSNGLPLFKGGEGPTFTSEYQPSPEAKKAGHRRKWLLKQLLDLQPKKGTNRHWDKIINEACEHFGIQDTELTNQMLMEYRMLVEASRKGNVAAFRAITERVYGRPRQEDAPPPVATPDEEQVRQKSQINLGDGIQFEL